jgi:TonB family protein
MLKKLAAALCLFALAAAATPAQDAQDGNRARPAPSTELPPAPDLPPAAPTPTPHTSGGGQGVGWGMPDETCFELSQSDFSDLFVKARVIEEAEIISRPEPGLTDLARRNGTEGFVSLGVALSKTGKVTGVWVFNKLPDGLTEKAVAAACQIKFRPAQGSGGGAVTSRAMLDYDFNVYSDEEKVERRAAVIEQPTAGYTEEARRHGTAGTVVLEVALGKNGQAWPRRVIRGLPHRLTEASMEAARRIKFTPAEDNGKKVTVVRRVEYVFSPD